MITKDLEHMKPLKGDEKLERDSEYMGADDIDANVEPILTIKNIYRGKVTLSRGKEVKNVMTFVEESVPGISEVRPLIVNSTNRQTLKRLYGQVTAAALEGKKIQLWIEHGVRNPSKNELTDGIRIRDKKPTAGGKAPVAIKCADCGNDIVRSGKFSPEQIIAASKNKYGVALCMECAQKRNAEAEAPVVVEDNKTEQQDNLAAELMAEAGE